MAHKRSRRKGCKLFLGAQSVSRFSSLTIMAKMLQATNACQFRIILWLLYWTK